MSETVDGSLASALIARIEDRRFRIGVIGLGYVGIPLVLAAVRAGFEVIGFDVDEARVAELNQGRTSIRHIPDEQISAAIADRRFSATTDLARLGEPDGLVICVPTPLTRYREPDLTFVVQAAEAIAARLRRGQFVSLESTTYPGTTEEVIKPILERGGLKSGEDFFLAYSPEREDPGNAKFATASIPKVVGGDGAAALSVAESFYGQFVVKTVSVSSTATAEAAKLTENIFRAVNIGLVNELKMIFDRMGIDVWEVIDAAATKPFGYMPFYPGPGLGGHCISIDPFYLTWKAREFDGYTRFIELAGEINALMPDYVVRRTAEALDRERQKALSGSRILLVGVAYKKNVDDMRESPSLKVATLLEHRGAKVDYHDPHIARIEHADGHTSLAGRTSVALTPEVIASYDLVLVGTDHDDVDYATLARHAPLVIDTRNAFAKRGIGGGLIVKA